MRILRNSDGKILRTPNVPLSVEIKYGYLYNWYAASDSRNIANTGWHLPSKSEYETLQSYLGGQAVAGGKMKETGFTYWASPNTGATNESKFNGRASGYRANNTGGFSGNTQYLFMWTSTAYDSTYSVKANLVNTISNFGVNTTEHNRTGLSIRLIKDSTTLTNGQSATYIGNDGKVYRTIYIGTQEWLADNLAETKYRNGGSITEVTYESSWVILTSGARCVFNNYESNMGTITYGIGKILREASVVYTPIKYGLLYNWWAATDSRNIAASGWHVPTGQELQALRTYLDGSGTPSTNTAGSKLKETGTVYWNSPNTGADNASGFNARGGGSRNYSTGVFQNLKSNASFWTSTLSISTLAEIGYIDYNNTYFRVEYGGTYRAQLPYGFSIRLVKTTTTLTNGQTGTYTGNDGKVYRTICIGTQEWLADNLAETKYRNGDTISEVTSNSAWAALTTGALCAYNNDWSNV